MVFFERKQPHHSSLHHSIHRGFDTLPDPNDSQSVLIYYNARNGWKVNVGKWAEMNPDDGMILVWMFFLDVEFIWLDTFGCLKDFEMNMFWDEDFPLCSNPFCKWFWVVG